MTKFEYWWRFLVSRLLVVGFPAYLYTITYAYFFLCEDLEEIVCFEQTTFFQSLGSIFVFLCAISILSNLIIHSKLPNSVKLLVSSTSFLLLLTPYFFHTELIIIMIVLSVISMIPLAIDRACESFAPRLYSDDEIRLTFALFIPPLRFVPNWITYSSEEDQNTIFKKSLPTWMAPSGKFIKRHK